MRPARPLDLDEGREVADLPGRARRGHLRRIAAGARGPGSPKRPCRRVPCRPLRRLSAAELVVDGEVRAAALRLVRRDPPGGDVRLGRCQSAQIIVRCRRGRNRSKGVRLERAPRLIDVDETHLRQRRGRRANPMASGRQFPGSRQSYRALRRGNASRNRA